jgi:hypothetical protein
VKEADQALAWRDEAVVFLGGEQHDDILLAPADALRSAGKRLIDQSRELRTSCLDWPACRILATGFDTSLRLLVGLSRSHASPTCTSRTDSIRVHERQNASDKAV